MIKTRYLLVSYRFVHLNGCHYRKTVLSEQRELPGGLQLYSYIHKQVKSGVHKVSINVVAIPRQRKADVGQVPYCGRTEIIINIIIIVIINYLLQLSFHSVTIVLTLVTNKNKYT
jgi:hypothetical protein